MAIAGRPRNFGLQPRPREWPVALHRREGNVDSAEAIHSAERELGIDPQLFQINPKNAGAIRKPGGGESPDCARA